MKIFFEGSKRSAVARMFPVIESMGHKIVKDCKLSDIQLSVVYIQKKTRPTVLRLDNVWYELGTNYNKMNKKISESHSIADAVIYQSFTSMKICKRYLEKRKTDIYDVIYNGIVPRLKNDHINDSAIHIASCSKWRRVKRLPEIIQVFNSFLKKYPNSYLHIIGSMLRGAEKITNKNVIYYDWIDFVEMKEIYKKIDVYLHLAKNDSCPSTVVEAISFGIPVVTTTACGGATEMCEFTKNCFVCDGEDFSLEPAYLYSNEWNFLNESLESNIIKAMGTIIDNKIRSIMPDELKIETTTKKYLKVMERVLNET